MVQNDAPYEIHIRVVEVRTTIASMVNVSISLMCSFVAAEHYTGRK